MKWDFQNTENWEHLLPGEPTELRVKPKLSDDQDAPTKEEELFEEKHLDMPPSWVQQLHIGISGNIHIKFQSTGRNLKILYPFVY